MQKQGLLTNKSGHRCGFDIGFGWRWPAQVFWPQSAVLLRCSVSNVYVSFRSSCRFRPIAVCWPHLNCFIACWFSLSIHSVIHFLLKSSDVFISGKRHMFAISSTDMNLAWKLKSNIFILLWKHFRSCSTCWSCVTTDPKSCTPRANATGLELTVAGLVFVLAQLRA